MENSTKIILGVGIGIIFIAGVVIFMQSQNAAAAPPVNMAGGQPINLQTTVLPSTKTIANEQEATTAVPKLNALGGHIPARV